VQRIYDEETNVRTPPPGSVHPAACPVCSPRFLKPFSDADSSPRFQTLVYVSYSTRLDKVPAPCPPRRGRPAGPVRPDSPCVFLQGDDDNKSRFKSTTCAINAN
jgi:hypothetical protein